MLYKNIGADGLKTGYTEAGGYGLIGTATDDKRRILMVVNGLENETIRSETALKLIEWGLHNFENRILLHKEQIIAEAPVIMGKNNLLPIVVEGDITLTLPKLDKEKITFNIEYKGPLKAPIQKGQKIGILEIAVPERDPYSYPVFAGNTIKEKGFFNRAFTNLGLLLQKATIH